MTTLASVIATLAAVLEPKIRCHRDEGLPSHSILGLSDPQSFYPNAG